MNTKSSKKLSFLLYDEKKGPIYVTTDKGLLKFTLYTLPILIIIALIIIILGSVYFKEIREMARRKEPAIIKELKSDNLALTQKIEELKKDNMAFEQKLAKGVGDSKSLVLSLFKPVAGQEDLSITPMLRIEKLNISSENGKAKVNFEIHNQTKDNTKLFGYIHIHMSSANQIKFYPQKDIAPEDMLVTYNQGESFAVSRLRPVNAEFDVKDFDSPKALFKILIFSRTGDILLKKFVAQNIK